MNETPAPQLPNEDALFGDVSTLIDSARRRAAAAVNSELVMLCWSVGTRVREEVLRGGERGEYGARVVRGLASRLTGRYGRGYTYTNLTRMMKLAALYHDPQIVATLSQQLGWSHFVEILALNDSDRRDFYTTFTAHERWSVRTLRGKIDDKLYERTLAAGTTVNQLQTEIEALRESGTMTPALAFRDPYLLDFLDLPAEHTEAELERAILDEMQRFLLELGAGFAFVARQKRIAVDGEDYYLDLLFYHVKLRCYFAVELKTRKLQPGDKGQMELYCAWLDRHERDPSDNPTLGLVLCAAKGAEQVELLGLGEGAIRAAQYLTAGVREEMQRRLAAASESAGSEKGPHR